MLILGWIARLLGCSCLPSWKRVFTKKHAFSSARAAPEILVTSSSASATYRHNESPDLSVRLLGETLPLSSPQGYTSNGSRSAAPEQDRGKCIIYFRVPFQYPQRRKPLEMFVWMCIICFPVPFQCLQRRIKPPEVFVTYMGGAHSGFIWMC